MTLELAIKVYFFHVSLCKRNLSETGETSRYIRVMAIIYMHTLTQNANIG